MVNALRVVVVVVAILASGLLALGAATGDQLEEGRAVVGAAKADPGLPKVNLGACLREKGRANKLTAVSVCGDLVEACIQKCMAKYRATYGGRMGCNSACQE